jgi:ABC-type uncharacterized transport system fused permease/ATPase subunit
VLNINNVSVLTPDDKKTCLVNQLNLTLEKNQNLLISGQSSSGKTSLLRILADLWPTSSGKVTFLDTSGIYFMPQNPYLCSSDDDVTLKQQITFPETSGNPDRDDEIKSLLTEHGN